MVRRDRHAPIKRPSRNIVFLILDIEHPYDRSGDIATIGERLLCYTLRLLRRPYIEFVPFRSRRMGQRCGRKDSMDRDPWTRIVNKLVK